MNTGSSAHPSIEIVNDRFEGAVIEYARILHPAQSISGHVSWAEIADWAGRIYHPSMQFECIATARDGNGVDPKPWDGQVPDDFPMAQAKALAHLLVSFTETSGKLWCLVWDGHGDVPQTSRRRIQRPPRNYLVILW